MLLRRGGGATARETGIRRGYGGMQGYGSRGVAAEAMARIADQSRRVGCAWVSCCASESGADDAEFPARGRLRGRLRGGAGPTVGAAE